MNSDSVDLIYLDPPFNSNRNYAAPVGSRAAGAAFKDTWTLSDVDLAWHGEIAEQHPALYGILDAAGVAHGKPMKSYLIYMGVRLMELKRVLAPTGSIYLHCDDTAGAYLKMTLDAVFGPDLYRNTVTWKRTNTHSLARTSYARISDTLLYYAGEGATWNGAWEPLDEEYIRKFYKNEDTHGQYTLGDLTSQGIRGGDSGQPWRGIDLAAKGLGWRAPLAIPDWARAQLPEGYDDLPTRARLDALDAIGMIHWPERGTMPRFKRYLSMAKGRVASDIITDIGPISAHAKERTGYRTQKPLTLLERIIAASSKEGDMVLDPFCGCATALVAAEKHERQWIGIDISPKAVDLVRSRMRGELGLFYQGQVRTDVPARTDLGNIPPYNADINKRTLYGEQEGVCNGCRLLFPYRNLTIDHVVPQSRGGGDELGNLQLLCAACNSAKGSGTHEALIAKLAEQGIR